MQSFIIHHCVLLLLTLTFTTVRSQFFTSVMVKLKQFAVLPCEQKCSGSLRWTVIDNPVVIVAECNYTSCWSKEGFQISHDEYLQGNLSLTITGAAYTNRGLYTCERNCINIISTVRLSIEPRTLYVNLKPGEDLTMNVDMPGPKVVKHKGRDSKDQYEEKICSVIERSVQCNTEYTARVTLTDAGLILNNITLSDNGVYSVWDKNNNEINLSYILHVTEATNCENVKINGSVTLPCTMDCPGLVKWTHRGKVVAQCNVTSCEVQEGYKISRDQQHREDLSLSIIGATFSAWGVYECKCNDMTINKPCVTIVTKSVPSHLKPGDDLLMDFPLAEELQVVYNGSVIYPIPPINIHYPTNKAVFKGDYTHRLQTILKLENINMYDSGDYIIQNEEKQALLIYNVSVNEDQPSPGDKSQWTMSLVIALPLGLVVLEMI